jgi:glycosyltransferase involved in cell wall biosynthesis
MKIGIDCRTILNPGFGEGAAVGHYTYCLVEAMVKSDPANRYVLFFDRNVSLDAVAKFIGRVPNATIRQLPFHEYRTWMPGFYSKLFLPAVYAKEGLDVLLEPSTVDPSGFGGKKIVVVHDEHLVTEQVRRASRIIVPSEVVKRAVRLKLKIDEKEIDVIPYGVTPQYHFSLADGTVEETESIENRSFDSRVKYGLSDRFVFFLGTINPRKNVHALMRAFARQVKEHPGDCADLSLALAGGKGEGSEAVFEEMEMLNDELQQALGRRPIRYLGYVTMEEKWDLLERATVFAYPALQEGFSLSVLEAMSVGAPVLSSNRGVLPELVGTAGLLVDPDYTNELYHGLARLLHDEVSRKHFSEAGKKRAAEFTWSRAAKETLQTLHKAMMR